MGAVIFSLRAATLDDAKLLFDWRNDELTRAMSFSSEPVSWPGHIAWLGGHVGEIQIAEIRGAPVGQIRISDGEVSYSVDRDYRRMGIGRALVRSVMTQHLKASVKTENDASNRIFRSLGWVAMQELPGHTVYVFEP